LIAAHAVRGMAHGVNGNQADNKMEIRTVNDYTWMWIVAGFIVLGFIATHGSDTGYQGRDGKYDVYCGYKQGPLPGDLDYECEREPAKQFR
jgi:hypothetical protein